MNKKTENIYYLAAVDYKRPGFFFFLSCSKLILIIEVTAHAAAGGMAHTLPSDYIKQEFLALFILASWFKP